MVAFYIRLGPSSSTGPNSRANKPSISPNFINFLRVQPCQCKVMRPDFRSRCSCGEIEMKRINLLWADGRDVHYPMDKPNLAHVECSGRGKTRPGFFKPTQRFGAKIVPHRTPHETSECSGPTLL